MSKGIDSKDINLDQIKKFSNQDYSQWVSLIHSYQRFRNRRENEFESGYEEVYCLQEGFYIRVLRFDIHKSNNVELTFAGKHLLFCLKIKGKNILRSALEEELMQSLTAAIYYFNEDEQLEDICEESGEYLMVMLVVKPDVLLESPFLYTEDSLPNLIKPAFADTVSRIEFKYSFGQEILMAANALVDRKVTGDHELTYIQCKAVELLCLLIQDLALLEANVHLKSFAQKDLDALAEVKRYIDSSFREASSIPDMAKEFDISESRLKTGFKSLYGLPVRAYVQGLRMQKAQQLLMDRKLNIDLIAWELGYNHTSNFITAFKQHFGMTPKFYQRHMTSTISASKGRAPK